MTEVKFEMTALTAALLREPFAAEHVGKLPRVYCKACRDAQFKVCQQHTKVRCRDCGNNITSAHLHLDYVGHAEITDRLLHADPTWTWEPAAFGPDGLPLRDQMGGLWIRLTVAGVSRLGYGHADGKTGPDAVKEAIGDALRNAAMRFGVALDLWGAKFKDGADEHPDEPDATQPTPEPPARWPSPRACVLFGEAANAGSQEELRGVWERTNAAGKAGEISGEEAGQIKARITARGEELTPPAAEESVEDRTAEPPEIGTVADLRQHAQEPMDGDWPAARKPGTGDPA